MVQNVSKPNFGTDGWRGIIGKDFNSKNCFLVAHSLFKLSANIKKVIIGYDTRQLSKEISHKICNFYTSKGIKVFLSECPIPTPVVSFSVKSKNADFGIIITASHNSKIWNGIKIKNKYGQSISNSEANKLTEIISNQNLNELDFNTFESEYSIEKNKTDLLTDYIKSLRKIVDIKKIQKSNLNIIIDCMFGTSNSILERVLGNGDFRIEEINNSQNSSFPGIKQPEPIEENLGNLKNKVFELNGDIGFAFDADSDRVGLIDNESNYIEAPYTFCLIADHVLQNKKKNRNISTTISMTSMIDEISKRNKVECFRTKIGFKYVAPNMKVNNSILGGEESGGYSYSNHLLERDGIASALLLLEYLIYKKSSSSNFVKDLRLKYGNFFYKRLDLKLEKNIHKKLNQFISNYNSEEIIGKRIININREDGIKIRLENNEWILVRLSGTEPIARIYAESYKQASANLLISKFKELFIK
tara:strand:- start:8077 stop:9495 length:1419 start_codon:yes stop_codon:yes gene_type:complete